MSSRIWLRRAHDAPPRNDGRIWPRGVSRDDAQIDDWCPEVAPSDELRRWFGHDPRRWEEFQERYRRELDDRGEQLDQLTAWAREGRVTLVYGAKDREHNNAVVLRYVIEERRNGS